MTRLEALKELAKKVEAGGDGHGWLCPLWHEDGLCVEAESAYHGSLDAAKALHEAVLPGWPWEIDSDGFVTVTHPTDPFRGHWPDQNLINPARAWLLAILRALIAQEESA